MATLYDILGVDQQAKSTTLRHAYRRLARQHHPDISRDPRAHERMAEINTAFETLIDPIKRQEYDASLNGGTWESAATVERPRARTVSISLAHRLKAHRTPVYSLSFSPDRNQLVSSSFDNEVVWWHPLSFEVERRTKMEGGVVSAVHALADDRIVAAGCSESVVSVWNVAGGAIECWRNLPIEWIGCVAVSPDGRNLAMGSLHSPVHVCRTRNGEAAFSGVAHQSSVTAVAWSEDGRFLATGSSDASVKLWSPATGRELHTFRNVRSTVTAVAFNPDASLLAVAAVDLSIRIFDLNDLTLARTFYGHEKPVEHLAFHPQGILLGSASRDGCVGLWNAVQGTGHAKISASDLPLSTLAFSPDGGKLAASGMDRTVRIWDLDFGLRYDAP